MDNENKEFEELETQDTEPAVEGESMEEPESVMEAETVEEPESVMEAETVEEPEFDPTDSEDFYNNLEAAIGGEDAFDDTELPELSLPEDTFVLDSDAEQQAEDSFEEDIFAGVNAALSEHIEQEFGREPEESVAEEEKPNRFPTWAKILVGVILVLLVSIGLLFGTKAGKTLLINIAVDWAFKDIPVDETPTPSPEAILSVTPEPTAEPTPEPTAEPTPEPTQDPNATPGPTTDPDATPEPTQDPNATLTPTSTPTPTPWPVYEAMDDENIINVLLLGEENIEGANRGRTDVMIVVSINLNGGPLKMISFQRDLYVNIPGKFPERINAAYTYGNFKSAVETIEQNFGIDIDAYAKIDFKGFENLIDSLGGLRISLTPKESEYLNTTRYISKPSQRNTVAGYQDMTGAQVLGYCRVRMISTADGLTGDRGRNARHRIVLQALFEKFKDQNVTQLIKLLDECCEYVTVSSNLKDLCKTALLAVTEHKMYEIETYQVPQRGQYENKTVKDRFGVNDMDIIIYYPGAVEQLREFIYGDN